MPAKKRSKKEEEAADEGEEGEPQPTAPKRKKQKAKAKAKADEDNNYEDGDGGGEASGTSLVGVNQLEGVAAHPDKFKIVNWNINGLRAVAKKPIFREYIDAEKPDVLVLSEVKGDQTAMQEFMVDGWLPGYKSHWNLCKVKKGYSGVAAFWKEEAEPNEVKVDFCAKHDQEGGRFIQLDYDGFTIIGCYVPNAGEKDKSTDEKLPKNLDFRTREWDVDLRKYLKNLKNVIWCGDLNVCPEEIDIWKAKGNEKSAGFTLQERDSFAETLEAADLVDAFREKYPDTKAYSYFSARGKGREKHQGWRLDHQIVSRELFESSVQDVIIREKVAASDHVPVVLILNK